jgi:hypothetical protein
MRSAVALHLVAPLLAAASILAGGSGAAGPVWLIFVDDLHLSFANTGRLRTSLKTITSELIREGDSFAIRSSGPSSLAIDITADRSRLETAIKKATGNGLKAADTQEPSVGLKEVRYRASVALSAARKMIESVEHVHDRKKALIYVSDGYIDMTPQNDRQPLLAHLAGVAGVTIFTIDPRLLTGSPPRDPRMDRAAWEHYWLTTRNSLRVLAEMSGGFGLEDGRLAETLKRINSAMRE